MNKSKKILVLVTVLVLIIVANFLVYKRAKKAVYISSIPIALIDGYIETMSKPADVWMLGNSTLDNGVLINVLEKNTGKKIIKTPIGSGTLEAQCMLALKALKENENLPQAIFLFNTKDDLNKNGYRAEKSESYIKTLTHLDLKDKILSEIPVYSYRLSLRHDVLRKLTKEDSEIESTTEIKDTVKEYTDFKTAYLTNMGKNYALNFNSLKELSNECKSKRIALYLIMPPVTDAIVKWQNFYVPKQNYEFVVNAVKKQCDHNGVNFYNFSDSVPSTTAYFKDVYHLNKDGAAKFTAMLTTVLKPGKI